MNQTRREVIILADYHEGIEMLASHLNITFDGVVNSLVYRGLREMLTPEVMQSAAGKQIDRVSARLKLRERDNA